jgi:hypothetical protein
MDFFTMQKFDRFAYKATTRPKRLLHRDPFTTHQLCIEKHKRQRILYEGKDGVDKIVGKETISFSREGSEHYINELTGKTHRLNRYTGTCSCTEPMECWKLLVPFLLRNCLRRAINLELVEPTVVGGLPTQATSVRMAWNWIIRAADSIDQAQFDRTKPVRLTYLPRLKKLALEDSKTQKILWQQIENSAS